MNEQEQMKQVSQLKQIYRESFSSDNGLKVLSDLELRCNYRGTSYVAGDANATAFEEGKRAVILHIHNMITEV